LANVFEAVIDAGATTINIPDTVGYAIPYDYGDFVRALMDRIANIDKAIVSVHCHDDLGLSVSNSLAAIHAGARQVECTINGLGSAPEMQVSKNRHGAQDPSYLFGLKTNVKTKEIAKTSRLVVFLDRDDHSTEQSGRGSQCLRAFLPGFIRTAS